MKRIDITGQRFDRLVAIRRADQDRFHRWRWVCRCDCGTEVVVAQNNLRTGNSKSCGCRNSDNAKTLTVRYPPKRGEAHYRWIKDRSRVLHRDGTIRTWARNVMRRDRYRCFRCGSEDRLHAHHIDSYAAHPERRLDPFNGVALCEKHHREIHSVHGLYATGETFHEYMGLPTFDRDLADQEIERPSDGPMAVVFDLAVRGGGANLREARRLIDEEIARLERPEAVPPEGGE